MALTRALLVVVLLSTPLLGQVTETQAPVCAGGFPSDNTVEAAYGSDVTSGSTLIATVTWGITQTFTSIADTQTNTWDQVGTETCNNSRCTRFYEVDSASAGATTVTATFSGNPSQYYSICVYEISTSTIDGAAVSATGSSTSPDPGNKTTAANNAAIFTVCTTQSNSTWTPGSGYTLDSGSSVRYGHQHDYDVGAAGSKATGMTASTSGLWACIAAAYNTGSCEDHLHFDSTYTQLGNWYEDRTTGEIRVRIENAAHALCDSNTDTISVAKGDTGAGALGGTASKAAVAGIATFTDLSWDTEESMTLDWTSPGITGVDEQATTVLDVPAGNYIDAEDNCPPVAGGLCFAPTDLDVRADVTLSDWTPASDAVILAQEDSFAFYVSTEGYLSAAVTTDGTTWLTCESDAAPSSPNRLSVRVTVDVDNGASGWDCKFYTKTSEVITNNVGWSALGSTITTATATSINDSSQLIALGIDHEGTYANYSGTLHQAALMNQIDGVDVADPDFRDADQDNGDGTWTDSSGNVWTEQGTMVFLPTIGRYDHPKHPTHPTHKRKP